MGLKDKSKREQIDEKKKHMPLTNFVKQGFNLIPFRKWHNRYLMQYTHNKPVHWKGIF